METWRCGVYRSCKSRPRLAEDLPKREEYRMTAQLIRAAISIMANIAEGNARASRKDYVHISSVLREDLPPSRRLMLTAETRLASPARVGEILAVVDEWSNR
ncbi:MAG: four helix bundle protein [Alphaproteobacteria bacterium]